MEIPDFVYEPNLTSSISPPITIYKCVYRRWTNFQLDSNIVADPVANPAVDNIDTHIKKQN